jgi:RHS repeat-associated protein
LGLVTDTTVYTPFGDPASQTGNSAVDAGFQGDYTDPTTRRVLMGSRWYGADVATFISADTQFGRLRSPTSLNRYTYAYQDPLRYFDPTGHDGFDPFGWAGSAVSNVAGAVGNAIGTVGNAVGQAGSAVGNAVGNAVAAVGNTVGNAVGAVGNAVSGAWNVAGQVASAVIQTGQAIIGTLVRGTIQFVNVAVQAVQSGWNTVVKAANAVWNGVTSAASAAWKGVTSAVSTAWNWSVGQASEFVTGLWSGLAELGQGLLSGVVLGAQCITGQLSCVEKLAGIASAIAKDPGKFLGSLIDWEDLSHGRIARWLGHLTPQIVLLLATDGAGNAIAKGGDVTSLATDTADVTAATADVTTGAAKLTADTADLTTTGAEATAGAADVTSSSTATLARSSLGEATTEAASGGSQIFYRGMSNAELGGVQSSGALTLRGGESFVTQERSFVEQLAARHPDLYQNIVAFEMTPGTREALVAAGARGPGTVIEEAGLGNLPWIEKGMTNVVYIKAERGAITYGLRSGSVNIFNNRILSFSSEPFVP